MRRNVRPLRWWEWQDEGGERWVDVAWVGVAKVGGGEQCDNTTNSSGIEHRQLVHKVFWPAYATINAVKALRRRLDMQKKKRKPKRK